MLPTTTRNILTTCVSLCLACQYTFCQEYTTRVSRICIGEAASVASRAKESCSLATSLNRSGGLEPAADACMEDGCGLPR
jgi:hypothetical protein